MSYDQASADYQPRDPYRRQGRVQIDAEPPGYIREMSSNRIRGADALVSRAAGLDYQMERLAKIIATNEEMFNQLSTRLTPFVRSLPIQEQEKRTQETGAQSPLADQVSRLADQLDRINRGMTFLIDGVDL